MRWDPFIPQHQLYNYASMFKVADFYAGKTSSAFKNAPPGLTFPGDPGFPGRPTALLNTRISLRASGSYYDPRGKGQETIRGRLRAVLRVQLPVDYLARALKSAMGADH